MSKKLKYISIFLLILLMFLLLVFLRKKEKTTEKNIDFQEIKVKGELIVGISSNSTDYFVYRGNPMGFQFEILTQFAERHNLKLKLMVENDLET
ncbi:MAG: lytic transglycosylase F, partial [Candidatus Delongbacteria bacterium]